MKDNIKLLYIDLFCGAGGTSTGVENAKHNGKKCAKVIACVNHDANAIASHAANHPEALHFTEDIRTLELLPLVAHISKMKVQHPAALVVLWASLECTNFSKAKGGQPRDADSRTLAEHLFRYIEAINPDYIQIENVEEFMSWGDLDEHGKPVSRYKGRFYIQWVSKVETFGYRFNYRIMNAADYGAYTSRKRFFGIFAKNGLPIVFPIATHSKTGNQNMFGCLNKWKPVKEVLDFTDEGKSIFLRKKELSPKTLERIYAGLVKFVAGGKDKCFLSKHFSGHPESKNISVDVPAHTITAIIRNCPWCIVPKKEGNIEFAGDIETILQGRKSAILLDNNILAYFGAKEILQKIAKLGVAVDFNQGLDARLVTQEIAEILSKIKWIRFIRFAYDTKKQFRPLFHSIGLLNKYGIKNENIFVYCLLNELEDSYNRINEVKRAGMNPYAQPYRDCTRNQIIPQWQIDMRDWCNRKAFLKTCDFRDYRPRKGFKCSEYFIK